MATVKADDIHKSYGKAKVLSGIGFETGDGEIFGIIGPDGAGKTTLFRILTSLLLADGGTASVAGYDVVKEYREVRKRVGYMPGRFSLYQDMSVEENLAFFAAVFGTTVSENYHLIKDIYDQIAPFGKRRAGKLSGGMKQKLALSCAMIHKPEVLFLDEPTTGVDAVSRKEFWDMLKKLQKQGLTIIVSTPYMDEATLCDRIALIKKGRFMTIDTPANIVAGFGQTLWAARSADMYRLLEALRKYPGTVNCYVAGDMHRFTVDNDGFDRKELIEYLKALGQADVIVKTVEPNIEDCYMQLANS